MQVRDRIKELRRVRAADLRPNAKNWRTHPVKQRDALRGLLAEIGYADALLARQLDDGSLELIDGHLRAETTPDALVPVLVLDVSAAEADKLLATIDPLAALAEASTSHLADLLAQVSSGNEAVSALLEDLRSTAMADTIAAIAAAPAADDLPAADEATEPGLYADYKSFNLTVTTDQERTLRAAVTESKGRYGAETTAEALAFVCRDWLDAGGKGAA